MVPGQGSRSGQGAGRGDATAADRAQARDWIRQRHGDEIQMPAMAAALGVSIRTLQYSFRSELGCTPLAEVRRMRLQALRGLLLDPTCADRSVADLMRQVGLAPSGSPAAAYRRWFGELPRQTREGRCT